MAEKKIKANLQQTVYHWNKILGKIVPTDASEDNQLATEEYVDNHTPQGPQITLITEEVNLHDLDDGLYQIGEGGSVIYSGTTYKIADSCHLISVIKEGTTRVTAYAFTGGVASPVLHFYYQNIANNVGGDTTSYLYSMTPIQYSGTIGMVTSGDKYKWNNKQDALVSGTNLAYIQSGSTTKDLLNASKVYLKTINGVSLWGSTSSDNITVNTITKLSATKNLRELETGFYTTDNNSGVAINYNENVSPVAFYTLKKSFILAVEKNANNFNQTYAYVIEPTNAGNYDANRKIISMYQMTNSPYGGDLIEASLTQSNGITPLAANSNLWELSAGIYKMSGDRVVHYNPDDSVSIPNNTILIVSKDGYNTVGTYDRNNRVVIRDIWGNEYATGDTVYLRSFYRSGYTTTGTKGSLSEVAYAVQNVMDNSNTNGSIQEIYGLSPVAVDSNHYTFKIDDSLVWGPGEDIPFYLNLVSGDKLQLTAWYTNESEQQSDYLEVFFDLSLLRILPSITGANVNNAVYWTTDENGRDDSIFQSIGIYGCSIKPDGIDIDLTITLKTGADVTFDSGDSWFKANVSPNVSIDEQKALKVDI